MGAALTKGAQRAWQGQLVRHQHRNTSPEKKGGDNDGGGHQSPEPEWEFAAKFQLIQKTNSKIKKNMMFLNF